MVLSAMLTDIPMAFFGGSAGAFAQFSITIVSLIAAPVSGVVDSYPGVVLQHPLRATSLFEHPENKGGFFSYGFNTFDRL